jgi:hypothetical protein
MRYGILDVSAGRESLTALFFSDIAPHARPAAFIVQGCRDFFAQTPPLVETLAGALGL